MAGASPWTLEVSLSDRWPLTDRLRIRTGLAPIDRLAEGGQLRHTLALQATAATPAFGVNGGARWNTPTRVRGASAAGDFRLRAPVLLNLDVFVRPHETPATARRWYGNTTITLLLQNMLNDYRRVTNAGGDTPPGYTRDEVDPVGRSIRLVVRKRF